MVILLLTHGRQRLRSTKHEGSDLLDAIQKLVSKRQVAWVQPHVGEAIEAYGLTEELVIEGMLEATDCERATKPEYQKISARILGDRYFIVVDFREDIVFVVTIVFPTRRSDDMKPTRKSTRRRAKRPEKKRMRTK